MESARALERAVVLDMIVAWRALWLCRLGKKHPALPASLYYSQEELAVLEIYKKKLPQHAQAVVSDPAVEPQLSAPSSGKPEAPASALKSPQAQAPSSSVLSLFQANILVAMLAGFWARKSDGHPGPKLVGQGLMILAELVNYRRLTGRTPDTRPFRPKRPREPG